MKRAQHVLIALGASLALATAACGNDPSSGTTTNGTTGGATGGAGTGGAGTGGGGDACNAQIVVALYNDDACTDPPIFTYTLDIAKPCSGWSRQQGSQVKTDSASRFACYRDRVCYTQYVGTETCDPAAAALVSDKESRTTCVKDPTPNIWARILSGTEGCPEAAAGFECPMSDTGTTGLAAACSGD
jgi:hypothetical protein